MSNALLVFGSLIKAVVPIDVLHGVFGSCREFVSLRGATKKRYVGPALSRRLTHNVHFQKKKKSALDNVFGTGCNNKQIFTVQLKDIKHMPMAPNSLISVGQLTDHNYLAHFTRNGVEFKTHKDKPSWKDEMSGSCIKCMPGLQRQTNSRQNLS